VALAKLGATDGGVVQGWLKEEHTYLKGLSKEPLEETLEMEYYKMVLSLRDSECVFFFPVSLSHMLTSLPGESSSPPMPFG